MLQLTSHKIHTITTATKAFCLDFTLHSFSCGNPHCGSRSCLWLFLPTFGTFSYSGLSHSFLIRLEVASLTETWDATFGWYPWEACPFLRRNWGGLGEHVETEVIKGRDQEEPTVKKYYTHKCQSLGLIWMQVYWNFLVSKTSTLRMDSGHVP